MENRTETMRGTEERPNHNAEKISDAFGWDDDHIEGLYEDLRRMAREANEAGVECCRSRIVQQVASLKATEMQKIDIAYQYGEQMAIATLSSKMLSGRMRE